MGTIFKRNDLSGGGGGSLPISISDVTGLQSELDGKLESPIAQSDVTGLESALAGKEPSFSKNTAFNKNFGTSAGTVAEGSALAGKQDLLVSGTNIKTINSTSLLGSGDIEISAGGESVNFEALSADKTLTASDATVQVYTCTADRFVNLPTTGLDVGAKFVIWNNNAYDSSRYLTVKQSTTTIDIIYAQKKSEFYWDGTNWYYDNNRNVSAGYFANGSDGGVAVGYSSYGLNNGAAVGVSANGQGYGAAVGRLATTNSKSYNTATYGAYSIAERNREFVSTATQLIFNKAQLTFQKYRETDLSTNSAAFQELFIDASSARLTIIASSVYQFRIQINAIDKTTFDVKTWDIVGAIKRNSSNTTSIVGSVTKTVIAADAATTNWDVQVTANDTNEALKIEVKHDSANQVRYSLNIFATETRI